MFWRLQPNRDEVTWTYNAPLGESWAACFMQRPCFGRLIPRNALLRARADRLLERRRKQA